MMNRYLLMIIVTLVMAVTRVMPHPWNFTPVIAGGIFLGSVWKPQYSVAVTLGAMVLSDTVLGFYSGMWVTYGLMTGVALSGIFLRNAGPGKAVVGATAVGCLFFLISNFSVWWGSTMYPSTGAGLIACYVAAIPFFQNQLISTVVYSGVFFGMAAYMRKEETSVVRTVRTDSPGADSVTRSSSVS